MSDTTIKSRSFQLGAMSVTIEQDGSASRVRVRQDEPLSQEDLIQLQILEHELGHRQR